MTRYYVVNLAYGCGSWGDEMVLDGALNRLGRENCIVFSADPQETMAMHQVEAVGVSTPVRFDILYVGGGGWGYPAMAQSVAGMLAPVVKTGSSVVVEAAGLRAETPWAEYAHIFRQVERFTVRDSVGQAICREHFGREAEIVPDLALHMAVESVDLGPGPWVGVNVVNQAEPQAALLPLLRACLQAGYKLVGLPTISHKSVWHLDGHLALRRLSALLGAHILDLPGPWYRDSLGPRKLAGVAANCRFVVGMRKHGCYLGARVGVPVLMVDWYADHGLPHRLAQLRSVMPRSRYCDLLAGDDPLAMVRDWIEGG